MTSGDLLVNSVLPPVSMVIERDLRESFSSEKSVFQTRECFFQAKVYKLY